MSQNDRLLNSLPLSVGIDPGVPKCYPVFRYDIDVRTRNLDSDTVPSRMVNQVKDFIAIDFFDIHGNIFIKIWS